MCIRDSSMTQGIISAKDRSITMSDGTVMNMLQTDTCLLYTSRCV